ncbi:hypothetical protein DF143_32695 [Burkholderia cenocepacia]|nr:hypothetical protein DF143_32695 [Burkholderia cenocepacia]RQV35055.1 hypothetical protein DF033_32025 [Burkholderia cenocepacia]
MAVPVVKILTQYGFNFFQHSFFQHLFKMAQWDIPDIQHNFTDLDDQILLVYKLRNQFRQSTFKLGLHPLLAPGLYRVSMSSHHPEI